jgi:ubiquinone/menaquinone biosynthesis C-methylase UbiE
MSTSPLAFDALVVQNILGQSFLDVGCGYGKWGYLLKKYRQASAEAAPPTLTGVDLFEPHIRSLEKHAIYDSLHVASALKLPFKDKTFDSTIACEILEHLPRIDGPNLISELRRVSRQSFVVTTPNFACLRGGGQTIDGFNQHEAHLHNFLYREFRTLGFTQIVGIGFKTPSFKLSRAVGSLGYYFPRFSRYLIGFWFADGKKRVLETE